MIAMIVLSCFSRDREPELKTPEGGRVFTGKALFKLGAQLHGEGVDQLAAQS